MFRAISRFFRAMGYLLVGKVDAARLALGSSPDAVRATFDRIIDEKKKRITQYKDAVGAMIAQEEKKKAELTRLSEETVKLEKLKQGATIMARKVVERHSGDAEAVRQDPEYAKCQAAFLDFSSTLEEKEARCASMEEDVAEISRSVDEHKSQLTELFRELEKIKAEKHETVGDLITAKEEQEMADMMAGISQDRTSQDLQELRDLRQKTKATARVSREMAGIDTKHTEEEFVKFAEESVANTEFDALIGLAQQTDDGEEDTTDKTRIPEA